MYKPEVIKLEPSAAEIRDLEGKEGDGVVGRGGGKILFRYDKNCSRQFQS